MTNTRFCPLASGSSGNSIYIGAEDSHILIDAGLSGKRIQEKLQTLSVSPFDISAIFISHEHSDHIQGAGVLSRRFDIPVYASKGTWSVMERFDLVGKIAPRNRKIFTAGEAVYISDSLRVCPFKISHDAVDPSAFNVLAGGFEMSVLTDVGVITESIKDSIKNSHVLLIESNHDVDMLKNGSYPLKLQKRILGDRGHLSNVQCGTLLAEIFSPKIKHVFLGHLSGENNRPEIAYNTVASVLAANKINAEADLHLRMASRDLVSFCIEL